MDRTTTASAARLAVALFADRVLEAVRPLERDGLRLDFAGTRLSLVLAAEPAPGWLVPVAGGTGRLRGGRGAWPEATGIADRELAGRRLEAIELGEEEGAIALRFSGGGALELHVDPGMPRVLVRLPGERVRVLPEGEVPPVAGVTVKGWRRVEGAGTAAGREELTDRARLLESGWRERRAAERFVTRRADLERALRREARRLRRARAATRGDGERAADPVATRRAAEALLAAGPRAERRDGTFVVPDPYAPGRELEIPAEPPGAPHHEVAERLFRRARRAERGRTRRAERDALLERRERAIASLLVRAREAATQDDLDGLADAAVDAGLALRSRPVPSRAGRRRRGPEERPARAFRSPSGYEVLAGRSARQNDRLTFRVASPDDLWLHVRDRPGAHVVVRTGQRTEPPEPDVLFAARIAAAFSRAPEGEVVEVHVARRKHVRKPRGGAPGQVLVRRSRTVSVRVGPLPD